MPPRYVSHGYSKSFSLLRVDTTEHENRMNKMKTNCSYLNRFPCFAVYISHNKDYLVITGSNCRLGNIREVIKKFTNHTKRFILGEVN